MTTAAAVVLALVQGATEFLPVSSKTHVALAGKLLGIQQIPVDFLIVVHLGTLAAVVVYYRADMWAMLRSLVPTAGGNDAARASARESRRLLALLLVGTVPAAVLGYALKDTVEELLSDPRLMGGGLLVTAALLAACSRMRGSKVLAGTGWRDALLIGAAQAMALLPGISRSGATIFGGLACGLERSWAPRFAFLLSAPTILGGFLLKLKDIAGVGPSADGGVYLLAAATAAVSGYLAILLVSNSVRRGNLLYFSVYCAVVGLLVLGVGLAPA